MLRCTQASSVTDEEIAKLACESWYARDYGPGRCKAGRCGGFQFYHFDGYPSCDAASMPAGEYHWIFRNHGMQHVSEDADGAYNVTNATTTSTAYNVTTTTTTTTATTAIVVSLLHNRSFTFNITTVPTTTPEPEPVPDMLNGDGLFTRVRTEPGSKWSWKLTLLRLGGQLRVCREV